MRREDVDFDEVQKAMEDTVRDAFDYFLDRETGDVIILSEDILRRARELLAEDIDDDMADFEEVEFDREQDLPEWMEDEIELAVAVFVDESGRYLRIPERSREKAFAAMKEFAEKVESEDLRSQLEEALDGTGAFRRFKDMLDPHPGEKKRWYGFNARAARKEIEDWLTDIGLEGFNN
jgi:hypothetical protein